MTRETKIGLLVGLAFIIVIGILLSDYNRNESPAAALNAVAGDVQKGAATPHNGSTESAILPPPPTPAHHVPTHAELHLPAPMPPRDNRPAVAANNPTASNPVPPTPPHPVTPLPPVPGPTAANPPHPTGDNLPPDLHGLIHDHPHELIPANPPAPANPPHTDPPTVNGAVAYVAVPGDTVSRLAGRFLGGNTTANRNAILAINPSLKQDPNKITVGKTYMIPPKASAAAPTRTAAATPPSTPTPPADAHYYIVKENDSLWRIASQQLGDSGQVAALKEANKDVLKGSDTLRINMRLKLPAKSIASVN